MGAVLLCAGTRGKRYALPNSDIMIHQVSGGAQGQASDVERTVEYMFKLKKRLIKILSDHCGQNEEKVKNDSDRDYYMSAAEAKTYGLVDQVVESRKELKADSKPELVSHDASHARQRASENDLAPGATPAGPRRIPLATVERDVAAGVEKTGRSGFLLARCWLYSLIPTFFDGARFPTSRCAPSVAKATRRCASSSPAPECTSATVASTSVRTSSTKSWMTMRGGSRP